MAPKDANEFHSLTFGYPRDTKVSKEPQPVHALENTFQRSVSDARRLMATAGNGTAGRKPPSRETTFPV
jgi:hypothetical protein